jgi:uncharacterized protein
VTTSSGTAVATPYGDGRMVVDASPSPLATLLLSHGAGQGIDTHDLVALAESLPEQGISVVRFEQPWRVAGRPVASPPATLDVGLRAAAAALAGVGVDLALPLVVGGRSAGARSACRMASSLSALGVLALAFPLHPPGRPEKSRAHELESGVPTLVVQGENDPMGRPDEFPAGTELATVPGGDHSFRVAARAAITQEDALAIIVESALEWIVREVVGTDDQAALD